MDDTQNSKLDRVKGEPTECKKELSSRCTDQESEFVDYTSIMVSVPLSASDISEIDSIGLTDAIGESRAKEVSNSEQVDTSPVEPMEVQEYEKSDLPDTSLIASTAAQSVVATCNDELTADLPSTQPNKETRDDTNVDESDVVMLTDSDDEDTARKNRVIDTAEMIEKFSSQGVTLEVVKPLNDKVDSAARSTENVGTKANNNDTNFIMLDDSPESSEVGVHTTKDSAERNAIGQ